MKSRLLTRWIVFALWVWMLMGNAHAQRVALLVGNSGYNSAPLTNPANDVKAMEAALKAVGFEVTKVLNANQSQLKRAVRDFGNRAKGAEMAMLYYSGHGTQVNGENYLIPVGANIEKAADYDIEAVSANSVLAQLREAQPRAAVVVLDACRDNPHVASTKSLTKGLARMDAPTGTMIAFATAPNDVAQDNGLYARELAKNIQRPGLELLDVFRDTTAEVRRQSGGKQVPRISEVSIDQRIYLAGPGAGAPAGRQGVATVVASVVPEPVRPAAPVQAAPQARQAFEPEMQRIAAGRFTMGSPTSEKERRDNEGPQRTVSVRAFELGKTEVTQGQWKAVMGSNPSGFSQCGENCPVESVSWDDAQSYIQKLNEKTGKSYRLPSEAEWEYAARAGCESAFNVGGQCAHKIEASEANFNGDLVYNGSSQGVYRKKTTPVGSFKANNWGLNDMHGNVWEWVQDCYENDYSKGQPNDGSAHRADDSACSDRVLRGGSWIYYPQLLRAAYRDWSTPADLSINAGFRLARTVP